MRELVDQVELAARNNAAWCSIVCGAHGVHGVFDPEAWTCPTRTPDYYPDAVTLQRGVEIERLLARVDRTTGCSIKDSFAELSLTPAGFEPLFDASWIWRPAVRQPPSSDARWRIVRDAAALDAWETTWRDGEEAGPRTILPSLLERDDVAILAISMGDGADTTAILNVAAGVVGLSNVVTGDRDPAETFATALDAAGRLFPDLDVVGYEQGSLLDAARQVGFEVVGPLRVWMHA